MTSSILYKFKSAATFEILRLPGSAARVRIFDIKKAIVKAKKLDKCRHMDFELEVSNADTGEDYGDENMTTLRGARFVVKRIPAPKGKGILRRLEQNECYGGIPEELCKNMNDFYTIDSTKCEDDLVAEISTSATAQATDPSEEDDLQALQAVTEAFVVNAANDSSISHSVSEISYQRGQTHKKTGAIYLNFIANPE